MVSTTGTNAAFKTVTPREYDRVARGVVRSVLAAASAALMSEKIVQTSTSK